MSRAKQINKGINYKRLANQLGELHRQNHQPTLNNMPGKIQQEIVNTGPNYERLAQELEWLHYQNHRYSLNDMPAELKQKIAGYLSLKDKAQLAQVDRSFRWAVNDVNARSNILSKYTAQHLGALENILNASAGIRKQINTLHCFQIPSKIPLDAFKDISTKLPNLKRMEISDLKPYTTDDLREIKTALPNCNIRTYYGLTLPNVDINFDKSIASLRTAEKERDDQSLRDQYAEWEHQRDHYPY